LGVCFTNGSYAGGSSQHPKDDVTAGEALIKATYEAIRNSPIWPNSLLIITYDEHGCFYDSVAPGPAPAPADNAGSNFNQHGFTFMQYGVRVPARIVSPLIPKGTVNHTIYDHASIPATLERLQESTAVS
jgi:phospholipase C